LLQFCIIPGFKRCLCRISLLSAFPIDLRSLLEIILIISQFQDEGMMPQPKMSVVPFTRSKLVCLVDPKWKNTPAQTFSLGVSVSSW
jgi:hypothetical protein